MGLEALEELRPVPNSKETDQRLGCLTDVIQSDGLDVLLRLVA